MALSSWIPTPSLRMPASLISMVKPHTPEATQAHQNNARAVMEAYGFSVKDMTESKCVAELMKMYQELTERKSS